MMARPIELHTPLERTSGVTETILGRADARNPEEDRDDWVGSFTGLLPETMTHFILSLSMTHRPHAHGPLLSK